MGSGGGRAILGSEHYVLIAHVFTIFLLTGL